MSQVAGKSVVAMIGPTSASLATIGAYDLEFPRQVELLDVTDTESGGAKEFLAGLKEYGFSYSRWFDDTDTPYVEGDSVYFQFTAGSKTYGADCIVEQANMSAQLSEAVRWSYTLKVNGAIDES